jgi:hypothetical protein
MWMDGIAAISISQIKCRKFEMDCSEANTFTTVNSTMGLIFRDLMTHFRISPSDSSTIRTMESPPKGSPV